MLSHYDFSLLYTTEQHELSVFARDVDGEVQTYRGGETDVT